MPLTGLELAAGAKDSIGGDIEMAHGQGGDGGICGVHPAVEQAEARAAEVLAQAHSGFDEPGFAIGEVPRGTAAREDGVLAARVAHLEHLALDVIGMLHQRGGLAAVERR